VNPPDPSTRQTEPPTQPVTRRTRGLAGVRGMLADTKPLRTPAYRRLWLAAIVTTIGSQLTVVAVPYQLYQLTDSSAWVGLTGLFGLVPLIVFGLWGGAIADAVDRRTLLLVTVTGIAGTSLLLFVTAATGLGGVWLVLSLFALQTAFIAVDQPTRSAVLPRLLPAEQLLTACARPSRPASRRRRSSARSWSPPSRPRSAAPAAAPAHRR